VFFGKSNKLTGMTGTFGSEALPWHNGLVWGVVTNSDSVVTPRFVASSLAPSPNGLPAAITGGAKAAAFFALGVPQIVALITFACEESANGK
jgi:hypothetical protein